MYITAPTNVIDTSTSFKFLCRPVLFASGGSDDMPHEKRSHQRVPTKLTVLWEGFSINNYALMTDVSQGGCYINSAGRVGIDEHIRVDTFLVSQAHLHLECSVAHREWP